MLSVVKWKYSPYHTVPYAPEPTGFRVVYLSGTSHEVFWTSSRWKPALRGEAITACYTIILITVRQCTTKVCRSSALFEWAPFPRPFSPQVSGDTPTSELTLASSRGLIYSPKPRPASCTGVLHEIGQYRGLDHCRPNMALYTILNCISCNTEGFRTCPMPTLYCLAHLMLFNPDCCPLDCTLRVTHCWERLS